MGSIIHYEFITNYTYMYGVYIVKQSILKIKTSDKISIIENIQF